MLGGFLYGFDIGATSFVLAMLLDDPPHDVAVWWKNISPIQQGLFVSGLSLGALVGSHIVLMYLSQKVGRRMELRLSALLYIVGTLFNAASGTLLRYSPFGFLSLFLGRIMYGVGVSFVMQGAPKYLAEQSPPEIRGAVVSAKETVIVGGIVLGYAFGNHVSTDPLHWTDLYVVCGLMALPMLLLTFYIPRSKRWLIQHGFDQEAYESMKFVYKGDIQEEFEKLVEKVLAERQSASQKKDFKSEPSLWNPQYRNAMAASMGLIVFQQFSGQPSVLSYATVLFQAAGWSGNASVVTSVLMMMTSMIAVLLVERVGRKVLLCACCVVMMLSLSALSTAFWGWDDDVSADAGSTQKVVILCSMFFYIAGYQLGFGPITWCIVSEIFPSEIKCKAIALGVEMNYALNFAVQFAFPIIVDSIGWGPSFSMFAVILAFAFFYIQAFVPETTGLTLEEIQLIIKSHEKKGDKRLGPFLHPTANPSESTQLLASSSSILGGAWNLEEMEDQLQRTKSDSLLHQQESRTPG
jgi:sugar porter (SP) family MFS transporter